MTTEKKPAQKRKAAPQRAAVDSPPIDGAAPLDPPATAHEFALAVAADVGLTLPCRVCGTDRAGLLPTNPCPVDGHRPENA